MFTSRWIRVNYFQVHMEGSPSQGRKTPYGRESTKITTEILLIMCVCMVTHIARVWINRDRLSVLHVVSWTGKRNISRSAFVPENLVSRDGFGRPVPRQPAHLHTYSGWIWCLLTGFLPSSAAASTYSFITAIRHRVSPELIGLRNYVPMAFTAESPPARGQ